VSDQPGVTFTYDGRGNLTFDGVGTYSSTVEDLLASATVGGVTTTYRYDGDQQRLVKITGGVRTYTVHGPGGALLAEYRQEGTGALAWVRDYLYLGTRLLAMVRPAVPDPPPLVSIGDVTVGEGAGTATFAVQVSWPAAGPVTVQYATVAGTATAGADFVASSGPVTFDPGETSAPVSWRW
jgi:YD repeat-containing protein